MIRHVHREERDRRHEEQRKCEQVRTSHRREVLRARNETTDHQGEHRRVQRAKREQQSGGRQIAERECEGPPESERAAAANARIRRLPLVPERAGPIHVERTEFFERVKLGALEVHDRGPLRRLVVHVGAAHEPVEADEVRWLVRRLKRRGEHGIEERKRCRDTRRARGARET